MQFYSNNCHFLILASPFHCQLCQPDGNTGRTILKSSHPSPFGCQPDEYTRRKIWNVENFATEILRIPKLGSIWVGEESHVKCMVGWRRFNYIWDWRTLGCAITHLGCFGKSCNRWSQHQLNHLKQARIDWTAAYLNESNNEKYQWSLRNKNLTK